MAEEKAIVEQPNSCKIAINAKGQYSGEVKVYAEEPAYALKRAQQLAEQLEDLIKTKNGLGA